jgi:hypothetical protein
MDLDRGVLARIDRRLLAGLGQNETYRMVRVPVTASKWSTWKRYCDSAGVSMGRAIIALVQNELHAVVGGAAGEEAVLAGRRAEELAIRESHVAAREREVEAAEERLRGRIEQLRTWEGELSTIEQRIRAASSQAPRPKEPSRKVGRNERCSCGSGLKYKHCHGMTGRR